MEVLSARIILRPVDLERSLRFYGETLGLKIYREYGSGESRGVVFFTGGGYLEITGRAAPVDVDKLSLWLQVPDLDEVHARLASAGVEIVDPPERKPWGLLEMWIRDPDGLTIVIVEVPQDHPLRRRA
ncbi:MAG: VOC family protein [Acidimicrobiia bacterium]|nr:VOC family protein [Acidimicrobiia bacterium]MBV9284207.1 VOC family protein [Acidimicrobiia bacterium]